MKHRYLYALGVLTLFCCVAVSGAHAQWYNYNDSRPLGAIVSDGDVFWVGSLGGGLIKVDKATGNKTFYNRANSGLRNHYVNDILLDNGMMWIATDGGLMKFDKNTTWTFYKNTNSGLPNNLVKGLALDSEKNLWLATYGGLAKFTPGGEWEVFSEETSNLPEDKLTCISIGTDNAVWVGTTNRGLHKFSGGTFTSFRKNNSGLMVDSVTAINANLGGEIWVGLNNGFVQKVEPDKEEWEDQIDLTVPDRDGFTIPEKPVWKITPGPDANTVLYSNYSSLSIFNKQTQTMKRYPGGATSNPSYGVHAAIADNGNIWACTMDGLAKRVDTAWSRITTATNGMSGNSVSSIMIDKSDKVLTAGGSLMQFDGNETWQTWPVDRFAYVPVENVTLDSNGTYWATCNFGGGSGAHGAALYRRNGNNYTATSVASGFGNLSPIVTTKDGAVWVGGQGGVAKYDGTKWTVYASGTNGLPEGKVNALAADKNSNAVWIATDFSGVVKFDGTVLLHHTIGDQPGMGNVDQINAITVDRATGDVWIGTNGSGASHWNGSTWTNYNTVNSGIMSDEITTITVDKYGAVWMGSGSGLLKFQSSQWWHFNNENSGLQDDHVSSIGIDSKQRIWIGLGANGMAMYNEQLVLGVGNRENEVIAGTTLRNVPNPFNGSTMLQFALRARAQAHVSVLDARGNEVTLLHNGLLDAGDHTMVFNAGGLPTGVYFARIAVGTHVETRPMILAR